MSTTDNRMLRDREDDLPVRTFILPFVREVVFNEFEFRSRAIAKLGA